MIENPFNIGDRVRSTNHKTPGTVIGYLHISASANLAASGLLAEALGIQSGNAFATRSGIITWNDRPGRTKRQVLAAFTRAIALASKPKRKARK